LDRRLAFLTLRLAGSRPDRIVAGCMGVTAFISMWVSNTATAAMMTPIALSVVELSTHRRAGVEAPGADAPPEGDPDARNFALAMLLGVAYASSIGGLGTIIGSPPNGILVRFLEQTYGTRLSFTRWMLLGIPVILVFLPVSWWMTTRLLFRTRIREIEGGRQFAEQEYRKLGPPNAGERATLIVFCAAVFLWVFRPLLAEIRVAGADPFRHLSDTSVAVGAALALFLFPVDRARGLFAADWATAVRLPWGVLLLFGGGLALADAVDANGVAAFLTARARGLGGWHPMLVVATLVAAAVFLSEITSNTAQVATMLPILAALAPALGVPPPLLLVPCTFGASLAFMMPVGTPPNAIVFGTGRVPLPRMIRAGFWLNVVGIGVVSALAWIWIAPLLGVGG
jgi:sodium-dependent dicarboxylate transporter 2/3/5